MTAAGEVPATASGPHEEVLRLRAEVERLRAEVGVVDALHTIGRELTTQLDIDRIVQVATDAATTATGAAFGAFFYNLVDQHGESYTLYTISGVPRESFSRFPMPRNTAVFAPTFDGVGTVRSADIRRDPRFGHNAPYHGMPAGHLPVCSYLAVPVISPTSAEVLGGFFFGHPDAGRFTERHEYLAEGIAGYTAIALDNARSYERERNLAAELSRSMLPAVPEITGLDIVARYLPAATGAKIGGDWFDVIPLPSGRTAFAIGDVVGHGVVAAAAMGQLRTAIRSYALLELPPSELLRHVSQLTETLSDPFATCFYAVHGPDGTLTYANAGHLPALLVRPDGTVEQFGEGLAQPLGIGTEFPERTVTFPPGADLLLYTDGLVESRTRDLNRGIAALVDAVAEVRAATDTAAACDRLVERLTRGRHDDDVALIHVHNTGALHRRIPAVAERLIGLRLAVGQWAASHGLEPGLRADVVLASYEAMANSAEHAYRDGPAGALELHAGRDGEALTVTVTDYGAWKPPDPADTYRGRGLPLIETLADASSVTHRADGTTVTMTWRISRPASTASPRRG